MGKIEEMIGLGVEFWNDSCDLRELSDAVALGAVGATSNPVIVSAAVARDERWSAELRRLARGPALSSEALAWRLVDVIAKEASRVLLPVHERTGGRKGFLNVQVSPLAARDAGAMIEHARHLAALAPNVAVKIPATRAGIEAIEALSALGIRTNATVSFSVPQAIAAAEAMERGARSLSAEQRARFTPYVTIMVGRVADHLRRVQDAEMVLADPGTTDWAGIAVFKKAHRLFRERGYRALLVAAAYRHKRQWSELVGDAVIQSIPYAWWRAFDASDVELASTIERPIPPAVYEELVRYFPDFARAYDEQGMSPDEFERYGASVATLAQFEKGYRELVAQVARIREAA